MAVFFSDSGKNHRKTAKYNGFVRTLSFTTSDGTFVHLSFFRDDAEKEHKVNRGQVQQIKLTLKFNIEVMPRNRCDSENEPNKREHRADWPQSHGGTDYLSGSKVTKAAHITRAKCYAFGFETIL